MTQETLSGKFDFTLTAQDVDLTRMFMMALADDNKEYFTSDDFRDYELHKDMTDPAHQIGMLFAKWKANRVSIPVGEEPSTTESNNRRRVDLWRWDWVVWRKFVCSSLDNFVFVGAQASQRWRKKEETTK